jgi:hypothetical protein
MIYFITLGKTCRIILVTSFLYSYIDNLLIKFVTFLALLNRIHHALLWLKRLQL